MTAEEAMFVAAWNEAQGHGTDDLDGAKRLADAVSGTPLADANAEWFTNMTQRRSLTLDPRALSADNVNNHDYPEGSPERAVLDWMGFPRPDWMDRNA